MKYFVLCGVFFLATCDRIFSQSSVSFGPELGFASNFSSSSKTGFGGSAEYANRFSKNVGARAYLAYHYFKGKYFDDHISFLPARGGIQAFLGELLLIYAEAGIASYHDSNNTSESGFSYALGAGYRIPLGLGKQYAQISAYYNFFRFNENLTYTWFNIRLAYGLNFGKKNTAEK